jgi:hypothetical protein
MAVARGFGRWEARIRDGLRAMHARGDLPASVNPDDLALATLAALQGGLLLAQVQRETRPLEVALDAMLDRIQALAEAAGTGAGVTRAPRAGLKGSNTEPPRVRSSRENSDTRHGGGS